MDIFIGVFANAGLVLLGTFIGSIFKSEIIKRIGERVFQVYAFFVLAMGVNGAADISDPLLILSSLVIGVALGEIIDLDKQFNRFGDFVQSKFSRGNDSKFSEGFVQATLLFCIGSMTFMGALESALQHSHTIYITKGVLDCISALSLTMGFGIGVALSAVGVIVYQGALVILASLLSGVLVSETVAICTTIGSLFLIGIGTNMLGITKIKVANFLPAMFVPIVYQLIQNII